jgi:hypothetical protein
MYLQPVNNAAVNDTPIPNLIPTASISFNGFDLSDCTNLSILSDNELDLFNYQLDTYFSPRADWWWVLVHSVTDKQLVYEIAIKWDTNSEYLQLVDEVKENITKTEWDLIINYNWEFRQTKASVTIFKEQTQTKDNQSFWVFDLEFTILKDFESFETTSTSYLNITWDLQEEITNEWTKWTNPTIYFVFTNAVSLNELKVTIWWFEFSINSTINPWDVIAMYWDYPTNDRVQWVYINESRVASFWRYPFLDKFSNHIKFEFEAWSTVDVDITVIYNRRYY